MERKPIFMIILTLIFFSLTISATSQTPTKTGQDVKNECLFSSKEIDSTAFQLTYIEAVKHSMSTAGKKYSSIIIQLANYDRGDRSYHPNPKEEGQRRVTINFSAPTGKKLKAGPYSLDGGMAKDFRLSVGIEKMGKSVGLYNGTGTGEILFIDDKTITARVKVQDIRGTIIEAAFFTVWEKSRY